MAELTIKTDDITEVLRKHLEGFARSAPVEAQQVGRILEVGDGIARVSGLPNAAVNEILEFEGGTVGLALNLDEESIGAVILGEVAHIEEGQSVRATGRILNIEVGDSVLGRVINALGHPIDGRAPTTPEPPPPLEARPPGFVGHKPVHEPLQTGIKAIDAMT